MCTQQLIWCACGHGEFLPIEPCARARTTGYCWTVVWGDAAATVVPAPCSYCQAGLGRARPLGRVVLPHRAGGGRTEEGGLREAGDAGMRVPLRLRGAAGGAGGVDTQLLQQQEVQRPVAVETAESFWTPDVGMEGSQVLPVAAAADMEGGGTAEDAIDPFLRDLELGLPPVMMPELDDVMATDFGAGFDLAREMGQCYS